MTRHQALRVAEELVSRYLKSGLAEEDFRDRGVDLRSPLHMALLGSNAINPLAEYLMAVSDDGRRGRRRARIRPRFRTM
jgi:hypothetical protein